MAFDLKPLLYCHWCYIAQSEQVHTVGLNQKINKSAVSLEGLSGNTVSVLRIKSNTISPFNGILVVDS